MKKVLLLIAIFSTLSLCAKVSLKQENLEIYEVTKNTAKISRGNLVIGQSGIIKHTYKNNLRLIFYLFLL